MASKNRMTAERFSAIEQGIADAKTQMSIQFVDFKMFCEVFNELKALREERK